MRILVIASFLSIPLFLFRQKQSYLAVGVSGNSYNGELGTYKSWSPGFCISTLFNPTKKLNGSVSLSLGSFSSEKSNFDFRANTGTPTPNNFVKTNFVRLNYAIRYNLVHKEKLIAYVSQGIGFLRFNPKDDLGEDLEPQDNTRQQDETYRNISFMLPTSLGALYFLPNKFAVSLELGLLNTTTDYLDNISEFGDSGNDNIITSQLSLIVPLGAGRSQ